MYSKRVREEGDKGGGGMATKVGGGKTKKMGGGHDPLGKKKMGRLGNQQRGALREGIKQGDQRGKTWLLFKGWEGELGDSKNRAFKKGKYTKFWGGSVKKKRQKKRKSDRQTGETFKMVSEKAGKPWIDERVGQCKEEAHVSLRAATQSHYQYCTTITP